MLHKKHGELSMCSFDNRRPGQELTAGEFKDLGRFSPCFLPFGKAGELQILCCQGFAVELLRLHP